jgi:NitT/TauT family transport system permease protein
MATASSDTPAGRVPAERVPAGERLAIGSRVLRWISNSWMFLAFFAGCILFWQFAIDIFEIPRFILPKPTTIVEKGWADIDRLLFYTYITGSETIIGYVISVVLAVPLGLSIAFSSILRRTLYPLCVSVEMVPKIAFAPLFVSWLGFGLLPKVIIVVLVCFFPIVLNSILAFGSLNEELTRFCRRLQVRGDQRHRRGHHRGVHRQRSGARLLHSDRDRQHAA